MSTTRKINWADYTVGFSKDHELLHKQMPSVEKFNKEYMCVPKKESFDECPCHTFPSMATKGCPCQDGG